MKRNKRLQTRINIPLIRDMNSGKPCPYITAQIIGLAIAYYMFIPYMLITGDFSMLTVMVVFVTLSSYLPIITKYAMEEN